MSGEPGVIPSVISIFAFKMPSGTQIFDMCHADIGDNRSIRLARRVRSEISAKVVHTHFDDRCLHRFIQLQQGFGQADPIVKVALSLEGFQTEQTAPAQSFWW